MIIAQEAHKIYVCRLYRRALKTAQDWYWQRAEFREKALILRQLFDQNKLETSPQKLTQLLATTEYHLAAYAHPQPYIRIFFR